MRILILSDNYPPETNAGASRTSEHAEYWASCGHEVSVITGVPNFPQGKIYPGYRNYMRQCEWRDGVRVVRVKTFIASNRGVILRTLDFLSFMVSAWWAGLFESRPDVILATSPQFFAALGGWGLAVMKRVPFIFELRDLWPASIAAVGVLQAGFLLGLMEKLELFLYRRAKVVISLTRAFRENLIQRGIPAEKIVVMSNGVDLIRYRPRPRNNELAREVNLLGRFVVGYIGTHGMAHGLHSALAAAALLSNTPSIRFLFVGDGATRIDLIEQARQRCLANVVFVSPQPKDRIAEYWSLCDVALISLKDDPVFGQVIPSKIFEAMGMGLPLLLSVPRGEASALVESHGAGMWVPPGDPVALSQAVAAMHKDRATLSAMATCSRTAATNYDRARIAGEFESLLQQVIERKAISASAENLPGL